MNDLLNMLISLAIILGIAVVIGLIIFVFWTVWYIPIEKELKYNEKLKELNMKYDVIDAKTTRRQADNDREEDMFRQNAARNHQLQIEINEKMKRVDVLDKSIENLKYKLDHPEELITPDKKPGKKANGKGNSEAVDANAII